MAHNPTTDPHNLEGRITFDRGHNPDPPASDCDAGEALDQNNVLIEVLHEVDLFEEDSEVEGRFFQRVERQLKMLRGLAHVNVAEFQGWMVMLEDESWLRAKAVHAGCEGGKVMAYLSINANADRRDLVVGVSRGLSYLHSKGIVHGNLNPSNVHIDYDVQRRPVPRISGFESSYTITDDDSVNLKMEGACSAPLRYIAPEVMAQLGFLCGQKGDVWSFGCTSSQMLLGKRPYGGIRNDYHIPSVVARHVDPYVWDSADLFHEMLRSCLVHDPSLRATSSNVAKRLERAVTPKSEPRLLELSERRHEGIHDDLKEVKQKSSEKATSSQSRPVSGLFSAPFTSPSLRSAELLEEFGGASRLSVKPVLWREAGSSPLLAKFPAKPRGASVLTEHTSHATAAAEQPPSLAVPHAYQARIDESTGASYDMSSAPYNMSSAPYDTSTSYYPVPPSIYPMNQYDPQSSAAIHRVRPVPPSINPMNQYDPQSSAAIHGVHWGTVEGSAIMDSSGCIQILPSESTETHSEHGSIHPPLITEPTSSTTAPRNPVNVNLVQRVVATHRVDDYNVLIVGHKSAIPSTELFWILKTIFEDADGDGQAHIREGVVRFLEIWVSSRLLDVSLHSGVMCFAHEHLGNSLFSRQLQEIQAALQRPARRLPTVRYRAETSSGSAITGSSTSSGQRKTRQRTIVEIMPKDLTELARALLEVEMDNWGDLTMAYVVKSLSARRDEQITLDSKPFSPLAEKIQDWVNEECLNKRYSARQKAFQLFYLLACECEKLGNLASSQAIACALRGEYIRKFNFIRGPAEKSAGGSEMLREALQRLSEPPEPPDTVPAKVPPLDHRLRRLVPVFHAIRDDVATINWEACKLFYQNLKQVLQQPLLASPETNVPEFYHEFLRERMYEASSNRSNHQDLSERLSTNEAREVLQMQVGAGFGF